MEILKRHHNCITDIHYNFRKYLKVGNTSWALYKAWLTHLIPTDLHHHTKLLYLQLKSVPQCHLLSLGDVGRHLKNQIKLLYYIFFDNNNNAETARKLFQIPTCMAKLKYNGFWHNFDIKVGPWPLTDMGFTCHMLSLHAKFILI